MQTTAALSAQNYRRTALPHSCICAFYCMHSMEIRACTQESENVKTQFQQWFSSGIKKTPALQNARSLF